MANELLANSGTRGGADVVWLALHTAEGGYDSDPADVGIDAGSAASLVDFFVRSIGTADPKSAHAVADDDVLLDELVPYNRKAFTLRSGNPYSDNLEQMGLAKWDRATWLQHRGLLRNTAWWIADRARRRGWSLSDLRWLSAAQIRARNVRGVICHVDYTNATGDGTHWDCGPNYPRGEVMAEARAIFTGGQSVIFPPDQTEDDMTPEQAASMLSLLTSIDARLRGLYDSGFASRTTDGKPDPTHYAVSINGVNQNLVQLETQGSTVIAMLENQGQTLASMLEQLTIIAAGPASTDPAAPPA